MQEVVTWKKTKRRVRIHIEHADSPHSTPAMLKRLSSVALPPPTARPQSHHTIPAKTMNTAAARAAACGKVLENTSISVDAVVVAGFLPSVSAVRSPAVMLDGVAVALAAVALDENGQSLMARVVPALSTCTVRPTCLPPINFSSQSNRVRGRAWRKPFCDRYLEEKRRESEAQCWEWGAVAMRGDQNDTTCRAEFA